MGRKDTLFVHESLHPVERTAVDRRGAETYQGVPVLSRAVAHVAVEPVVLEPLVVALHDPVPSDLGHDRGGSYVLRYGIALLHRQPRPRPQRESLHTKEIDQNVIRVDLESSDRPSERIPVTTLKTDPVDPVVSDPCDAAGERHLPDLDRQSLALLGRAGLGVAQPLDLGVWR